jgi:hypothetical protein
MATFATPPTTKGTAKLDNSGAGPLRVPGFNGIRINYIAKGGDGPSWLSADLDPSYWPTFQHGANSWHGQRLTVREVERECRLLCACVCFRSESGGQ